MVHMNTKRSIILVTAFVTTIGAAMYPIFIYPLKNIDHYSIYHLIIVYIFIIKLFDKLFIICRRGPNQK
jgi:hypothetical protein